MYTLLAGSPPFWHRKQMLMLRMIMSGSYQFGSPEWDDYSDTVKDLVRGQAPWLLGSGKGQVHRGGEGCAVRQGGGVCQERPHVFRSAGWDPALMFSLPTLFPQVSRFLVVNPQGRLSAEEALAHPFFQQYVAEEVRHFSPRGKFKVRRSLPIPARPRAAAASSPSP